MNFITALLLAFQFTQPMHIPPHAGAPPACTAPTVSDRWLVSAATTTCNGGSACTSGAAIDTIVDSASASNATQTISADRPIYTTGLSGGLAGSSFNGSSQFFNLPGGLVSLSSYVLTVYGVTVSNTGLQAYFGGTGGGAPEIRMTSGVLQFLSEQHALIGQSATTFTNGSVHTFSVTYNSTSGAWAIYDCSGGTCNADASGTNVQSLTGNVAFLGSGGPDGGLMVNSAMEWDLSMSIGTSITGVGAYSACKFGI